METTTEETIATLARRQAGHLTRAQFLQAGLARSTVYRWVDQGRIVVVGARCYRLASVSRSDRGDVLAACLDVSGVASHHTAAWLHGLASRPTRVDITVLKGRSSHLGPVFARSWPVRLHTSTNLPAEDVLSVAGLPLTSVARTMLGLAALVPHEVSPARLVELISLAIERDLAALPWLWWLLEHRRCRGRNGVVALEVALGECSRLGPTESWLERELLRVLELAGLPLPSTQRVVRRDGHFVARVDFIYDGTPIVLEALGHRFHRTPAQLDADARRANELQLLGFDVYQFTARQIVERPAWVAGIVDRARASVELTVRDEDRSVGQPRF